MIELSAEAGINRVATVFSGSEPVRLHFKLYYLLSKKAILNITLIMCSLDDQTAGGRYVLTTRHP